MRGLLVDEVAVLDAAHTGLKAVPHALVVVGMGHDVGAGGLSHLYGGAQFLPGVLGRREFVGGGHRAARGHHLDLVGTQPELLPGGTPHLVGPVAHHRAHPRGGAEYLRRLRLGRSAPVPVPPGLREWTVADQQSRALDYPTLDRRLEAPVRAAGVPHSGESLLESVLESPGHHQGDQVGRMLPVLIEDVDVYRAYVDVGVGQPRHERHPCAVYDRVVPARRTRVSEAYLAYPLSLDHHGCPLSRLVPGTVYEEGVGEKCGPRHSTLYPPLEASLAPTRTVLSRATSRNTRVLQAVRHLSPVVSCSGETASVKGGCPMGLDDGRVR